MCAAILAGPAEAQDAAALRARHAFLRNVLAASPFQRPLHVDSSRSAEYRKGEIYATIEQPYGRVGPALQEVTNWCDVVILHFNVKHCRAARDGAAERLTLMIGKKFDQPLDSAYRLDFSFEAGASSDYLHIALRAPDGPLGTRDFRFDFEAAPLDERRTFIHLSYSYAMAAAARIAVQGYLATFGWHKVGFSVVARRPDGRPVYVGGLRGMVERNTMRYYLAVEAYLGASDVPAPERPEKRLRDWFAATERYALQLHEMERDDYLEMKRRELKRQQAGRDAGLASRRTSRG